MYQTTFELTTVTLNVRDLNRVGAYYRDVLGMAVLSQDASRWVLGIEATQTVLLTLQQVAAEDVAAYGLYHVAYLVPTRADLGDFLRHLIYQQQPIVGASDHGYSEAIYLEDPEGNGIEVYRDLPMTAWEVKADGRVIGKTEEMDGQGVFESGNLTPDSTYHMPEGTRIGHMHLSVRHSRQASEWYQHVLGVSDKFSVPTGSWLSTGTYHHQIAVNQWAGQHLANRQANWLGLAYFSLTVSDIKIFSTIKQQAIKLDALIESGAKQLLVEDPNGIQFSVHLA